jgi:hypothetical protein
MKGAGHPEWRSAPRTGPCAIWLRDNLIHGAPGGAIPCTTRVPICELPARSSRSATVDAIHRRPIIRSDGLPAKMPNSGDVVLQVFPHLRSRRGDSNPGPHHLRVMIVGVTARMVEPKLSREVGAVCQACANLRGVSPPRDCSTNAKPIAKEPCALGYRPKIAREAPELVDQVLGSRRYPGTDMQSGRVGHPSLSVAAGPADGRR